MTLLTPQDVMLAHALASHLVTEDAEADEALLSEIEWRERVRDHALILMRLILLDRLQLAINEGLDLNAERGVWVLMKFWDGDVVDVPLEVLDPFLPPGVLVPIDEDAS